jgi:hypothetical protein
MPSATEEFMRIFATGSVHEEHEKGLGWLAHCRIRVFVNVLVADPATAGSPIGGISMW